MYVIDARNVNDAYAKGLTLIRTDGVREESRAGPVLVLPGPCTTVYDRPTERVLMDPRRDANPFFHLFESLWILAGRNDATWLDRFVRDFSIRFAEPGGKQHGAYGFRWRSHFKMDQLDLAVHLLRADPTSRQVVLTMWDPEMDLGVSRLRDRPCNTHAYLRIRDDHHIEDGIGADCRVLDLTVCCRSNDMIWGAYGANAVHFSVLLEYLAARIGVGVGRYYQVSNNFHAYTDTLEKVDGPPVDPSVYPGTMPLVDQPEMFHEDLSYFLRWCDRQDSSDAQIPVNRFYSNSWLEETASPMYQTHWAWRARLNRPDYSADVALAIAESVAAPDWRAAALAWIQRRMK